jgi:hypothetical protein
MRLDEGSAGLYHKEVNEPAAIERAGALAMWIARARCFIVRWKSGKWKEQRMI